MKITEKKLRNLIKEAIKHNINEVYNPSLMDDLQYTCKYLQQKLNYVSQILNYIPDNTQNIINNVTNKLNELNANPQLLSFEYGEHNYNGNSELVLKFKFNNTLPPNKNMEPTDYIDEYLESNYENYGGEGIAKATIYNVSIDGDQLTIILDVNSLLNPNTIKEMFKL